MSKAGPYFDPKILLDMGQEVTKAKRPSRWDMELDGFSSNDLGRTVTVAALVPSNAAAAFTAFKWVARVNTKPEAARDWTITLGPLSPGNAQGPFQPTDSQYAPPNVSDAVCLVQWAGGHQGAPSFAFVDWWAGQQFSVFGSRVIVSGAVLVLGTAVGAARTHVLSGQLAPGLSRNPPRRTIIYPTPIGGGTSVVAAIPPFARDVSFSKAGLSIPGEAILSGELISGGTTIWTTDASNIIGIPAQMLPLRLPMGTNFIRVDAAGANDLNQVRLLYDLALS